MKKYALHILIIVVMVTMAMVVLSMAVIVRVSMAMVGMSESCETNDVDQEAESTDDKEFIETMQFGAIPKSFRGIENDL